MDKAHLKVIAQEKGTSVSQLIREQLIKNRILPATWETQDEKLIDWKPLLLTDMKLTIRDKKADIFDAYQQQQKQIEETCEQTKILFGVCFILLAFHLIWLWITKHL